MKMNLKKIFQAHSKDKLLFTPRPFSDWRVILILAFVVLVLFGVGHYFLFVYFSQTPLSLDSEPLIRNINMEELDQAISVIQEKGLSEVVPSVTPSTSDEIDQAEEL